MLLKMHAAHQFIYVSCTAARLCCNLFCGSNAAAKKKRFVLMALLCRKQNAQRLSLCARFNQTYMPAKQRPDTGIFTEN